MKKYLLSGLVAVLLMGACKKDYTAAFNTSSSNYYLYQSVAFNNTSNGGTSNWDFGDGTTSTAKSPAHSYSQPGNYTVTLIDGSSVATKALTVYHGSAAFQVVNQTQDSYALFTFSYLIDPTSTTLGYPINFIDQGTIAAGGTSSVYYTSDSTVYLGGILPETDTTFFVAAPHYPYMLTKNTVNLLILAPGVPIYKDNITGNKPTVQDIKTALAHQSKAALKLGAKRTAL